MLVDSSESNLHQTSPRHYYGANAQLKYIHAKGLTTELRAEFMAGKQTGTANNSETPVALISGNDGFRIREFNGAYLYLLQHIFNKKHQLLLKYDWYDPNTKVSGKQLGLTGGGFTAADIRFNTLGIGYLNYLTDNVKLVVYYAHTRNEQTSLAGYTGDLNDDVFTFRVQFRF